jgi:hypothetical protein
MKINIRTLIALVFVVAFVASCGDSNNNPKIKSSEVSVPKIDTSKTEKPEVELVPEILKGRVTKTLSAGEESAESSIYFEYFQIDPKSPEYLKTVNELISKAVRYEFEESSKNSPTGNLDKKYFSSILTKFSNEFKNVGEEFMPWTLIDSVRIHEENNDFIHLECISYSFTGGAHGNGYENHTLVDKKTGKVISLSDAFNNEKKLNTLVDQYFRKSQGISSNENLEEIGWFIEGKLKANNNFYFTDKHLKFLYNSYEIAPYAQGATIVEIPISKIKDLLNLSLD